MITAHELWDSLIRKLAEIRKENEPRIGSPNFTSTTGYDLAAWAEKGYHEAMVVVGVNGPDEGESAAGYAQRLGRLLEEKKQEFVNDPGDEDGGAAGAITDALLALRELSR